MITWSKDVTLPLIAMMLQIPSSFAYSTNWYFTSSARPYSEWPSGTYTLMQPASGCPNSGRWQGGTLNQDTEDSWAHNQFSANIEDYMNGNFQSSNIVTRYCTRNYNFASNGQNWPNGSYCILKYGSCPSGFKEGYVSWDDEDTGNKNHAYGTLPNEVHESYWYYPGQRNTKIWYCCRDDGPFDQAIKLPTHDPFILVRNGIYCQKVSDMTLSEVYIHWDDEDDNNEDAVGGAHPYDDGGEHDHRLHYCHYQNGNSTMTGPVVG